MTPTRPVLRYHGGKWLLAPWIVEHLPPHRTYVEPFGGAASVLLRKRRSHAEIYNDLDDEVVDLVRILRDPELAGALRRAIELTPFARAEQACAYQSTDDRLERARRLIVRSFMGYGSDSLKLTRKTGFRGKATQSGTTPAHDWAHWPQAIPAFVERLRGVVIENRDAFEVMLQHDGPRTLHYLDPPYLWDVRSTHLYHLRYGGYRHELTDEQHARLLAAVQDLEGMVVLSGYPSPLYEAALPGWHRVERDAFADGARRRTEVLWINPAAADALRSTMQASRQVPLSFGALQ